MPPTSASYVLEPRPAMDVHDWEQVFFAQDDLKLASHITLNLGLRYDLITPFAEKNDLLVNFSPTLPNPIGNAGVFIIPSTRTLPYLDTRSANYGYLTAAQAHVGRGLVNMDTHDIAPRLGIAWAIGDKSVIRAAVNLREPRIRQYNVTFERQIGWDGTRRVSYLGTHMGGLIAGRDLNELPPSTNGFGTTTGDGVTQCTPDNGDCALSPADSARYPFPIIGEDLLTYETLPMAIPTRSRRSLSAATKRDCY